ncbi:MAG: ISAs1 family transposase [Streptosporangiaceae bacterium]
MPVSHALSSAFTSTDEQVPGLLEVLVQVPDPRKRRGRRFSMVFVLAVAVVCVLAGAKSFREIGDQAADLPQELLAALGARPHPLRRRITAPSEKRIRTLLQELDAAALDVVTGSWLRALAVAGRLDGLLTAIVIDGKWLRGVAGGQVKLFAAMLHEEKVMIAQHRIPDDTNEITQVRELLDPVDLTGAVVTADAAHAQHDTAEYIAGERHADYLLAVKGNQPGLQRAIYDTINAACGTAPDHISVDYSHGRIIGRSLWVTSAAGTGFPHAAQVLRIRRDTYDLAGTATAKEIVHGITSLDPARGTPAALARLTRGHWGIESLHWLRDTTYAEDGNTGYSGNGPQVMATLRNIAISVLRLAGITDITRTLQRITRDRTRALLFLPL